MNQGRLGHAGWASWATLGAVALAVILGLSPGGTRRSLGIAPEGSGTGSTLTVTPSDRLDAGLMTTLTVHGEGFFPLDSVGGGSVSVAQCDGSSTPQCALATTFPINATSSTIDGTLNVGRTFTVRETVLIDCSVVPCYVDAGDPQSRTFARHHLNFLAPPLPTTVPPTTVTTVAPPATTAPPGPTTTGARPTTPSAPATTVVLPTAPGVTVPRTTATTLRRTTSTRPGTSTSAPTTTNTTVPPPPPGLPLVAVTPSSGPPGATLRVAGSGYAACGTVYFFFDGTRVGAASPDAAGDVRKGGLSVPGDTRAGPHRVTSSCDPSGTAAEQAVTFQVLPTSVHRSAFATSLAQPRQVSLGAGQLIASGAMAVGLLLLVAFPYELFNSTMEQNYDEIRAWFRLPARVVERVNATRRAVTFFALTMVTAVLCGLLSPDFGFNTTSLVLVIGMFAALVVMAVVFSLPADIGIHREFGEWGQLNFLPGSIVVSVVLVALSRLLHFQPGYFYGALAGLAFRSALSEPLQGRMTAANWLFSLVVSVAAWAARVPVSAAAGRTGASIWWIGLEACLAMIFLWGVEGLAVAMMPLRFLDGRAVLRWSRTGWAVLFFLGLFATVHVLLSPGSGYVGHTTGRAKIGVAILYAVFGLGSAAFWAYFRFRPARPAPAAPATVQG